MLNREMRKRITYHWSIKLIEVLPLLVTSSHDIYLDILKGPALFYFRQNRFGGVTKRAVGAGEQGKTRSVLKQVEGRLHFGGSSRLTYGPDARRADTVSKESR